MSSMKIWALGAALAAALPQLATAQTLRWSSQGDIATMDPYAHTESFTSNVQHHVYDPLVRRNRKLEIEPALATSWKIVSPDRWRFTLRPGVVFHNGNPFTADDVVASVTRLLDPGARARGNLSNVDQGREGRRHHRRFRAQRALSAAAERPLRHLHHGQGVAHRERRAEARQHLYERHHLCLHAREWHGAVHAGELPARIPRQSWS